MTSPTPDHWQIQDAKQRFSEMIRAVTIEGPQVITRHGEDVAVVVDIGEYRRLTRPAVDLAGILLGGPKLDDSAADVFAEVEAERKADFGRASRFRGGYVTYLLDTNVLSETRKRNRRQRSRLDRGDAARSGCISLC